VSETHLSNKGAIRSYFLRLICNLEDDKSPLLVQTSQRSCPRDVEGGKERREKEEVKEARNRENEAIPLVCDRLPVLIRYNYPCLLKTLFVYDSLPQIPPSPPLFPRDRFLPTPTFLPLLPFLFHLDPLKVLCQSRFTALPISQPPYDLSRNSKLFRQLCSRTRRIRPP